MGNNRQLIEAVQKMTGTQLSDKVMLLAATIDSVDVAKRTCNVTAVSGQQTIAIENVQLMADIDDGFLIIPAVNSTVIVAYSTFNKPFVSLFSGIDKVLLVAGEKSASVQIDVDGLLLEIEQTKVLIADGEIMINDGSLGGLVKVSELTTKLNNLENKVNDIVAKFNSHTHVLTLTTGTGTAAPTANPVSGTLTPTEQSEIENEKVKHGI